MHFYTVVVQNPQWGDKKIFRRGKKWFGESDAIGTSLEIDDEAHNKDILLLLVGNDSFSSFSFLLLDVFCSENKYS